MPRTLIVDYGVGNVRSVERCVARAGHDLILSADPNDVERCDRVIIAGVGHFDPAIASLRRSGFADALSKAVLVNKKPVLGICLGMEVMARSSEEGTTEGLGWLEGSSVRIDVSGSEHKVPHIGWNRVWEQTPSELMREIPDGSQFYFLHSYRMKPDNSDMVLSSVDHGTRFPAVIGQGNIFGVQFHPEKSHYLGQQLIKNFLEI